MVMVGAKQKDWNRNNVVVRLCGRIIITSSSLSVCRVCVISPFGEGKETVRIIIVCTLRMHHRSLVRIILRSLYLHSTRNNLHLHTKLLGAYLEPREKDSPYTFGSKKKIHKDTLPHFSLETTTEHVDSSFVFG